MKKLENRKYNFNKKTRKGLLCAVSILLVAVIVFVGAIGLTKKREKSPSAAVHTKKYMEYVIQAINDPDNKKSTFNILEVVPYVGMGEFPYYIGEQKVTDGIETTMASDPDEYYINGASGYGKSYEFLKINSPFSSFNYEVMYRANENEYLVRNGELFLSKVIPDYAHYLDGKINLDVCEANDLTEDIIRNADLIIISTGIHDNSTLDCYNYWSGESGFNCYTKSDGGTYTEITNANNITYATYEKDGDDYVSRDASWSSVEALLDVALLGRTFDTDSGEVVARTPVIMDNKGYSTLSTDMNIYKFMLLEKMLTSEQYGDMEEYLEEGAKNSVGVKTGVFKYDDVEEDSWTTETVYDFLNWFHETDIYKWGCAELETTNPGTSDFLTENYWSYGGTSILIPANTSTVYYGATAANGFTDERVGSSVTAVDVMRYMLGVDVENIAKTINDTITMLEIQPYTQFKYNTYANVKALAEEMGFSTKGWTADNYKNYFKVTSVSSSAFNSMNHDLVAEFDIIYMGMDYASVVTTDSNNKTIHNDTKLDGYVYLAFGDIVKVKETLLGSLVTDYIKLTDLSTLYGVTLNTAGKDGDRNAQGQISLNKLFPIGSPKWNEYLNSVLTTGDYYVLKSLSEVYSGVTNVSTYVDTQYGNMRLAGNDISQKKYDELVNYMNAGKVFVMEDKVYYNDSTMIYGTSNVSKFVAEVGLDKYNKAYTHTTSYQVAQAIENAIPTITLTEKPVEIQYTNGVVSNYNPDQNDAEPEYQIKYVFNLKGEANTTYDVKLVLDKNGDGLFDAEKTTDDKNEMYDELTVTTNANGEKNKIKLEVTLPVELTGPIAWQIQVTKIENKKVSAVRALETGYTAILGKTKHVKVLQIMHTINAVGTANLGVTLNMETNQTFQKLLQTAASSINFSIDVESINTKQFEELYYKDGKETGYSLKDNYDMIVIGFADAFGNDDILNDHGALDDLLDFVESGKSTLFTHDTTSFVQTPNYYTGTEIAAGTKQKIYAQTQAQFNNTSEYNRTETYNYEAGLGYYTTSGRGNNRRYTYRYKEITITEGGVRLTGSDRGNAAENYEWSYNINLKFRNILGMDKYGITLKEANRTERSKPYYLSELAAPSYAVQSSDGKYYIQELQGYTDMMILRYAYATSSATKNSNGLYTLMPYKATYSFPCETTKVVMLNEGQVTQYPYLLNDEITVATTHSQYYFLDMEDDDIVVWYSLKADGSSKGNAFYGSTDKDGSQNYYIYSKNNITYSGAGHSTISGTDEMKLFVNTIIRAVTSGNTAPTTVIDNGNMANDGSYIVYRNEYDTDYIMLYTFKDSDLLTGYGLFKSASVKYINTATGETKTLRNFSWGQVVVGVQYELNITDQDIIEAIEAGNAQFEFTVTDTYGATGVTYAYFGEKNLFELD